MTEFHVGQTVITPTGREALIVAINKHGELVVEFRCGDSAHFKPVHLRPVANVSTSPSADV